MTKQNKIQIRLAVQGMTCTGCENHVTHALRSVGAENISASFRLGEAVFELIDLDRPTGWGQTSDCKHGLSTWGCHYSK